MAILVNVSGVRKAFAARPLFEELTFSIETGERVGLIGPNGAGKSTLLRLLAGQTSPDEGVISFQRGLRVGFLEQAPSFDPGLTVRGALLQAVDDPDDWEMSAYVDEVFSKLNLKDPEQRVDLLSGGWKKRVALGRELVRKPDLLLLDEPTNHLDLESIYWLEEWVRQASMAVLTITHDRAFLQNVSNRILELDRRNPGGLLQVKGDYLQYLSVKEQWMASQERREATLKNTLRRETEWLKRGAKARTTKQQARIQRAGQLKDTVEELTERNRTRTVKLDFQASERSPKKLIEARGVSKSWGAHSLFEGVDLVLTPGRRVGILGSNGCGKSTLIQVLLKQQVPDLGTVYHAEDLKIAYFEQNRDALDPRLTVAQTICPSGEFVDYRGERIHIRSYLDRFLFSQGQMDMDVGKLSGGEQGRLLLAQLMLKPAQVLVLDEPTNDLDLATLSVLEGCLVDFPGAVLLVTHDRYFLDQVSNQILAFGSNAGGQPQVLSFASLEQWEDWHTENRARSQASPKQVPSTPASVSGAQAGESAPSEATPPKKKKLSYLEQREWDSMEQTIQEAEKTLAFWTAESLKPENLSHSAELMKISQKMAEIQAEVDRLYLRWAELESKSS